MYQSPSFFLWGIQCAILVDCYGNKWEITPVLSSHINSNNMMLYMILHITRKDNLNAFENKLLWSPLGWSVLNIYIFLIVALVGRLNNIPLHNSMLFILNSLNKLQVLILEKLLDYCKKKENSSSIAHVSYERSIVWEKDSVGYNQVMNEEWIQRVDWLTALVSLLPACSKYINLVLFPFHTRQTTYTLQNLYCRFKATLNYREIIEKLRWLWAYSTEFILNCAERGKLMRWLHFNNKKLGSPISLFS